MLSELTECTILMLKVIHDMYSKHRITYDEFIDYTATKIKFLIENINNIPLETDRKNANDIINKCTSLMKEDAKRLLSWQ